MVMPPRRPSDRYHRGVERIAALLEQALAAGLGSAAAVSVGDAGREVGRVVRGHARRVPDLGATIDEGAWFDVASLTKPIAAAGCAMVLAAERRLDLDAPIRRWFADAASAGTVRHLLGHAAGCAAHVPFYEALRADPPGDPRRELVARAVREPIVAAPGAAPGEAPGTAVYSDLGYIVLGAILERAADMPLEDAFHELVAGPLGLGARYAGAAPIAGAVATEHDDRGLVCGRVHDENAYYGGGACGHAGLFATIGDVARFCAAIADAAAGTPRGRLRPDIVNRFADHAAAPGTRRLGWDTPGLEPGVSHAGDRWPRAGAIGHLGFTGTSMWIDRARRRWVVLLTNRVHPSRHGTSAEDIKALRRAVGDAAVELLGA